MRKSTLSMFAASALAFASAAAETRIFGFDNIRRAIQRQGRSYRRTGSIATGNRHGGPHLHQREIARRLCQQAARSAVTGEYLTHA